MNKKHAREALDIYKRFLIRMDRVGEFLKTAEKFGIDKQDIPDLARVSKTEKPPPQHYFTVIYTFISFPP